MTSYEGLLRQSITGKTKDHSGMRFANWKSRNLYVGTFDRVLLPPRRKFREVSPFSATTDGCGTNHLAVGRSKIGQRERGNACARYPYKHQTARVSMIRDSWGNYGAILFFGRFCAAHSAALRQSDEPQRFLRLSSGFFCCVAVYF